MGDVELEEGEHDQVRHVERPRVPQLLPGGEVHVAALLWVWFGGGWVWKRVGGWDGCRFWFVGCGLWL